jgi:hypothetical protein
MDLVMMRLSALPKTWLFDLDGTLVAHNGHLAGGDRLLAGVGDFFGRIPPEDTIILLSSRPESLRQPSLAFLAQAGIRIDRAIFGLPVGERILFNDGKPSGLATAHAVDLPRDDGLEGVDFVCDPKL